MLKNVQICQYFQCTGPSLDRDLQECSQQPGEGLTDPLALKKKEKLIQEMVTVTRYQNAHSLLVWVTSVLPKVIEQG